MTIEALKECCLVSKSWIPRTRKHLFAQIIFHTEEDPGIMEEGVYRSLDLSCASRQNSANRLPHVITAADGEAGGWIRGFSRVTHLGVD
jgi:hypothetical protein